MRKYHKWLFTRSCSNFSCFFNSVVDPHWVQCGSGSRTRIWITKNYKMYSWKKNNISLIKNLIYLFLGLRKGRPSYRRSHQSSQEYIHPVLQNMKFPHLFLLLWVIFSEPTKINGSMLIRIVTLLFYSVRFAASYIPWSKSSLEQISFRAAIWKYSAASRRSPTYIHSKSTTFFRKRQWTCANVSKQNCCLSPTLWCSKCQRRYIHFKRSCRILLLTLFSSLSILSRYIHFKTSCRILLLTLWSWLSILSRYIHSRHPVGSYFLLYAPGFQF